MFGENPAELKKTEVPQNSAPKVQQQPELPKEPEIKKSEKPLLANRAPSKFSITNTLFSQKEETPEAAQEAAEELPANHFSDTDLHEEWQKYLSELKVKDIVLYSAINGFKLSKKNEEFIEVGYPSETAKAEFEKISGVFLNHFRHKVNNFKVNFAYRIDVALKKEVMTKKKLFDKFAEINPLLNDLNDLMKFDFS